MPQRIQFKTGDSVICVWNAWVTDAHGRRWSLIVDPAVILAWADTWVRVCSNREPYSISRASVFFNTPEVLELFLECAGAGYPVGRWMSLSSQDGLSRHGN